MGQRSITKLSKEEKKKEGLCIKTMLIQQLWWKLKMSWTKRFAVNWKYKILLKFTSLTGYLGLLHILRCPSWNERRSANINLNWYLLVCYLKPTKKNWRNLLTYFFIFCLSNFFYFLQLRENLVLLMWKSNHSIEDISGLQKYFTIQMTRKQKVSSAFQKCSQGFVRI